MFRSKSWKDLAIVVSHAQLAYQNVYSVRSIWEVWVELDV